MVEYYSAYLQVDGIIVFNYKDKLKKGCDTPIVSIVGIDNIETSGYLETPLTTIDIRHREVCKAALSLLKKKMKNKFYKSKEEICFDARLIVRDSTGKAKD